MLTLLYLVFIGFCLLWFLLASRKELPLLVATHAILQYAFTLVSWFFQLNYALSALLLVFLMITAILLVWARNLNFSRELVSIRLFFSMLQWVLVFAVGIFILAKSPFQYIVPSSSWHGHIPAHQLSVHPVIKMGGNLMLFTTFFHLILHWGQRWNIKKSLIDLGPIAIYLIAIAALRFYQTSHLTHPFS